MSMTRINDTLITISRRDPIKLAFVFFVFFIVEQLCSRVVEQTVWGDRFYHSVDLLALICLFVWYVYLCGKIAEKLTSIATLRDMRIEPCHDVETGVEYIANSLGGMKPRLDANGKPIIRKNEGHFERKM